MPVTLATVVLQNTTDSVKTVQFRWGESYGWESYTLAPGETKVLAVKPLVPFGNIKWLNPTVRVDGSDLIPGHVPDPLGNCILTDDVSVPGFAYQSYTMSQQRYGRVVNAALGATIINPFSSPSSAFTYQTNAQGSVIPTNCWFI